MSNAVMIIGAIGVLLVALAKASGIAIQRSLQGLAELRRADYAGQAMLIRAKRGDAELPAIHMHVSPHPRSENETVAEINSAAPAAYS
jgi:hypothetical protein